MNPDASTHGLTVVKVGGSLFDLPDLGARLRRWLESLKAPSILLVPGGGASADVVRAWDRQHGLGEEAAHWLALRALVVNAHLLMELLPGTTVVAGPAAFQSGWTILDAYQFACADEGRPGALPHSWDVTSDSLAVRVAIVAQAQRVILLKSAAIPAGVDWEQAGRCGLVDRQFAGVLASAREELRVEAVNLRAWVP